MRILISKKHSFYYLHSYNQDQTSDKSSFNPTINSLNIDFNILYSDYGVPLVVLFEEWGYICPTIRGSEIFEL